MNELHRKIREQRADFSHKLARMLVNTYDLIVFEDLQIKNMLQNHHLAKSIADASWYQLQRHTTYKAEEVGKTVVFVEPNGTSQQCSNCGTTTKLSPAERTFRCNQCDFKGDRYHNAAINILKRVGWGAAELTPAESSRWALAEAGTHAS